MVRQELDWHMLLIKFALKSLLGWLDQGRFGLLSTNLVILREQCLVKQQFLLIDWVVDTFSHGDAWSLDLAELLVKSWLRDTDLCLLEAVLFLNRGRIGNLSVRVHLSIHVCKLIISIINLNCIKFT